MDVINLDFDAARIRGTILGYKRFLSSAVWADMRDELDVLAALAARDYDSATDMTAVAKTQGRREAIDHLRQLPELILEALEEEAENKRLKEQENG